MLQIVTVALDGRSSCARNRTFTLELQAVVWLSAPALYHDQFSEQHFGALFGPVKGSR